MEAHAQSLPARLYRAIARGPRPGTAGSRDTRLGKLRCAWRSAGAIRNCREATRRAGMPVPATAGLATGDARARRRWAADGLHRRRVSPRGGAVRGDPASARGEARRCGRQGAPAVRARARKRDRRAARGRGTTRERRARTPTCRPAEAADRSRGGDASSSRRARAARELSAANLKRQQQLFTSKFVSAAPWSTTRAQLKRDGARNRRAAGISDGR